MTNATDFGALNWVKDELDVSVRMARHALESYVESNEDIHYLNDCIKHLHQIAGVLQMAQVYGPEMLAEEMEAVATAMVSGQVRQLQDASEALMLALIQLPDYLEKLQSGDVDSPLIILPLLNDLRAVRDASLLSEVALFRPDLRSAENAIQLSGKPNQELPELVHQLRKKFHIGLLSWFRQQQNEKAWRQLLEVFSELKGKAGTPGFYSLVWISEALIRGLLDQSIASGIAVKQLFSKVDRCLKQVIDQGESALEKQQLDDLVTSQLYYIAQSKSDDPGITEVKEVFELDKLLPSEEEINRGRQGLSGSNTELATSINEVIQGELTKIKDVLDLFMRKQAEISMLSHLEKPMRQLADTLGMIGQGGLRARLNRQVIRIKGFLDKETPPEEFELMEMAGDILFIESSLSTMHSIESSSDPEEGSESGRWGDGLPKGEYENLLKQTVKEAKLDIAKAKDAVINYTNSPTNAGSLDDVNEILLRVIGALKILELTDSAEILLKTTEFITANMAKQALMADRHLLNSLADVISSIEYFLESLVDGAGDRREILAIATAALNSLLQSGQTAQAVATAGQHNELGLIASSKDHVQPSDSAIGEISANEQPALTEIDSTEYPATSSDTQGSVAEKPPLEDIDDEILEIFIEEAREELETIQQDVSIWMQDQSDKNALTSFRRSFHTLKGSGRLVGAKTIGELAWSVENMLNKVIDETIKPSQGMIELLGETVAALPGLIDSQEKHIAPDVDVDSIIENAFALAEGKAINVSNPILAEEQLQVSNQAKDAELGAHLDSPSHVSDERDELEVTSALSEPSNVFLSDTIDSGTEQSEFTDSDLTIEVDSELLRVFADETENHLDDLEIFIQKARRSEPKPRISEEIVRAYHTLHGSAQMAGISPIANISKSTEKYLKLHSDKGISVDESVLTLLDESVELVRKFLESFESEKEPEPDTESYLIRLKAALSELERLPTAKRQETDEESIENPLDTTHELDTIDDISSKKTEHEKPNRIFAVEEDSELVEIFRDEANEILEDIAKNYDAWLKTEHDAKLLDRIQKGLHTLKGSAKLAGVMPVGALAQSLEKYLEAYITTQGPEIGSIPTLFEQSLDILSNQLNKLNSEGKVNWPDNILEKLEIAQFDFLKRNATSKQQNVVYDTEEKNQSELDVIDTTPELEGISDVASDAGQGAHEELFRVDDDPELLEVFFEEAKEHVKILEETYQDLQREPDNKEHIQEFQRVLHTIKGSSRLSGLVPIGNLSHAIETFINQCDFSKNSLSEHAFLLIRKALDLLIGQIEQAETNGQIYYTEALIVELNSFFERHGQEDLISVVESSSVLESEETSSLVEEDSEAIYSDSLSELVDSSIDDSYIVVGDDPELLEIFCEEAKEILEHLESAYQNWSENQNDFSLVEGMQRSLHTLKGSARLAGVQPIGDLSHKVETLLTRLVDKSISLGDSLVQILRQSLDRLASQVEDVSNSGRVEVAADLIEKIGNFSQPATQNQSIDKVIAESQVEKERSEKKAKATDVTSDKAVVLPFISEIAKRVDTRAESAKTNRFKASKDQIRISADLMDKLVNHAGEISIYRSRLEQQNSVLGFTLSELEQTVSRLYTQLRNLEIETEAQILYRWDRDNERDVKEKSEFDPLELDRFSNMQQLSRALVETVNDLVSINGAITDLQRETETLLLQQSRISTDLQDGLLRTRMVPFAQLIPRLQRLVRQTADQLDKKAHLECFGAEGKLDRNILNRMVPVLEHLLRNAVSHGIENPEDREKVDKDVMGRISLYIEREGTNVVITLSDDGRGLDTEAIRAKAIKQGMIDQNAAVSDDDLIQCVLNPGFSTATEITQIAGRGVGLDVVASEVKQLGGRLEIDTQLGRGTSFSIRLPLTLAITDALLVRVGDEIYAIPHGGVEGVVRIRQKELQACFSGDQEYYTYAGRKYKTTNLGHMMGIENTEPSDSVKWLPLLLVHAGEHNVAMQIDELLGTRQIVVKSIGKQAGSVIWITGGTILADGRVALILDVGALVRMDAARLSMPVTVSDIPQQVSDERIRVMVVDDSITVRKVTGRLLQRHNLEVITAKDGVEAVAMLQEQIPDIMLLDIEMPRMDGFEVARHVNNSVDYYGLPIIMITSRVGEKHRKRAFDLGVKRCLGKPYQETELLENIYEVLAEVKS